jgi:hypothetical protein
MRYCIVDSQTGTILDMENCYIVEADLVDGELSDSEIGEIAVNHGSQITAAERGQ